MSRRYDMAQIHVEAAARAQRNPVIFIHGFLGSKLQNAATQEPVWGRLRDAISRSQADGLALPIDHLPLNDNRDQLVPYALYESVAGVRFYGDMLDVLVTAGGYRMGDIANPLPGDTLFVYTYDWRRDNVEAAQGLDRAIERIRTRLGAPAMKFDLVAHSMGGLVALYHLKYGSADLLERASPAPVTWSGASAVGRLVLVGTPLHGTMAAFKLLHNGLSRSMSPEVVFSMPSVYQLLPEDGTGHLIDFEGNPLDLDLYDAETWVQNQWSVFAPARGRDGAAVHAAGDTGRRDVRFLQAALDRARAFRGALGRDGGSPPVPIHVFGSDCVPTLDRAMLNQGSTPPMTRFDDESTPDRNARRMDDLLKAPGDGTVTAASLTGLARVASTFFVCESHGLLPSNPGFQDNLFHVLFQSPEGPETARMGGFQPN